MAKKRAKTSKPPKKAKGKPAAGSAAKSAKPGPAAKQESASPEAVEPSAKSTELTDVRKVKLDCHAVVEASAGTGKTYTIEHVVLRVLCETPTELEQILIVTYTEKAMGELRERIRIRIEDALDSASLGEDAISRLRRAQDSFDRASIFTIHGFCNRLLSQHAFENGSPFSFELADDRDLLGELLREQQRALWPKQHGDQLTSLLRLAGFPGSAFDESAWEKTLINLASQYDPDAGDVLIPDGTTVVDVAGASGTVRAAVEAIAKIVDKTGFIDRIDERIKGNCINKAKNGIVLPARDMKHIEDPVQLLLSAIEVMAAARHADHGCRYLLRNTKKAFIDDASDFEAVDTELARIAETVEGAAESFLAFSARALREGLEQHKIERGKVSYHDMLSRVRAAAMAEDSLLLRALEGRYRYAIVDEFQDTDTIQWDIFRRLFVEATDALLMVIGDPKQAIYGFRGADVHAYIGARNEMLSGDSPACRYSLPVNWRSSEDMVEALNHLFDKGGWFSGGDGIGYECVRSAPAESARCKAVDDETLRPALTLLEFPAGLYSKIRFVLSAYARFVAHEVGRLLGYDRKREARLKLDRGKGPVPLTERDICILVRSRREAASYEHELRAAGIPYSFYKQPGIWDSAEAEHLAYLLDAIKDPANAQAFRKVLMTRFFGVAPEDLQDYAQAPPSHPARVLLTKWRTLAQQRRWSSLFSSVLEQTGVLLRDLDSGEAERRRTNYLHIIQFLEREAYSRNLDIVELARQLEKFIDAGMDDAKDSDLHRIETERPSVQIMTMHAAKGLEFPVVFVGGLNEGSGSEAWYRFYDGERRVYDLLKQAASHPLHKAEAESEDRRLLYVALTRAMHKLYVPVREYSKRSLSGMTMPRIVSAAVDAAWQQPPDEKLSRRIVVMSGLREIPLDEYEPSEDGSELASGDTILSPEPAESGDRVTVGEADLWPPRPPSLRGRMLRVHSYSSLVAHSHRTERPIPTYGERAPRDDDDAPAAADVKETTVVLPAGAETGTMLHEILERIDFAAARRASTPAKMIENAEVRRIIDEAFALHLPAEAGRAGARNEAARLAWCALRTPLGGAGQALCDIAEEKRRAEVEFYMPLAAQRGLELPDVETIASDAGPLLHGFIDLVFESGGKYFILDWKSNLLGSYSSADLSSDMSDRGYDFQYALYAVALSRWLKRFGGGDAAPKLGGVYYLYLRGLNGDDESGGVFYRALVAGDTAHFESELAARVGMGRDGIPGGDA